MWNDPLWVWTLVSHACVGNEGTQVGLAELERLTHTGNFGANLTESFLINTDTNLHVHFLMLAAHTHRSPHHNGPLILLYRAIINRPIPLWLRWVE